jgi:hypothetical protein
MQSPEKILHQQICKYLDYQYPELIYTSDMSGMRVSIGLRVEMQKKRCKGYCILDLLILHPSNGYHGLLIELKIDRPFKKDGTLKKSDHLTEQQKTISRLNELGYFATFGVGFDDCKNIIDKYLKNEN